MLVGPVASCMYYRFREHNITRTTMAKFYFLKGAPLLPLLLILFYNTKKERSSYSSAPLSSKLKARLYCKAESEGRSSVRVRKSYH